MKYIDADLLRKEIEKMKKENKCPSIHNDLEFSVWSAKDDLLDDILHFLDTIPEQPVEGLEEEISRYLREKCSSDNEPSVSEIARHFAEWGAEHLKR